MSLCLPSSESLDTFDSISPAHQETSRPDVSDVGAIRGLKAARDLANALATLCLGNTFASLQDTCMEPSKQGKKAPSRAREPRRTAGTWRFMSAALLWYRRLPVTIPDELESFFHVILYMSVRHLRSSIADDDLSWFIHEFFDGFSEVDNSYKGGFMKTTSMVSGCIHVALIPLRFYTGKIQHKSAAHPLNVLMTEIMPVFKERYALIQHRNMLAGWYRLYRNAAYQNMEDYPEEPCAHVREVAAKLDTHMHFSALLRRVVDECDWPETDFIGDRMLKHVPDEREDEQGASDVSSQNVDDEESPNKRSKLLAARDAAMELDDFLPVSENDDTDFDKAAVEPKFPLVNQSSSTRTGR